MKAAFLLTLLTAVSLAALPGPVKVDGGQVEGVPGRDGALAAFKGIPFAAPPVGALRWTAPRAVTPWQGVRAAKEFGASCMQPVVHERKPWTHEFMTHNEVSEDCLFVNVWTGSRGADERRPVFVYVYGGGFNEGSGQVPAYDGEGLAKKGLVVVTFNYRVGVLGFLTHTELSKESGRNASGNYALLDQIAALEWVKRNIGQFGGDAGNVTVAGQSAGAMSVHLLTASAQAKGLFHKAIAQSGSSAGMGNQRRLAEAEADGLKFGELKGATTLAALRALTWEQLTAPAQGAPRFGPVVDGYFLSAPVREIYAQGKQNDVATLTGCNRDEGGAVPKPTVTAAEFEKQARQRHAERAEEFLKLYPAGTDEAARAAANAAANDQSRVSMYLWARERAKTAKTPAYTYFWTHTMPGEDAARFGAFHSSEVPYVLNTLYTAKRPFVEADHKIADTISSYWANFARTGVPSGKGLAAWPAVGEKPETMEVGDAWGAIGVAGSAEKFAFWSRVLAR